MEEVVRAFNWVIEKGWVSATTLHVRPAHAQPRFRRSTGPLQSGPRCRLKRPTVRF